MEAELEASGQVGGNKFDLIFKILESSQLGCFYQNIIFFIQLIHSQKGEGGADGANKAARKEINAKIRLNKILLRCSLCPVKLEM